MPGWACDGADSWVVTDRQTFVDGDRCPTMKEILIKSGFPGSMGTAANTKIKQKKALPVSGHIEKPQRDGGLGEGTCSAVT